MRRGSASGCAPPGFTNEREKGLRESCKSGESLCADNRYAEVRVFKHLLSFAESRGYSGGEIPYGFSR